MTTTTTEIRFTAKRACRWDNVMHRWITISQETAQALIAMGAMDLTDKRWI
jgi:hypothetical protein